MLQGDDDSQISNLKKQLEASLARSSLLEKENHELRQEVARLKAQINSLKAHDNERKSMLWKKLQNSMDSSNADLASQHKQHNLDVETTFSPKPNFQELQSGKDRSIIVPKPPPRPTPAAVSHSVKQINHNQLKVPSMPTPAPAPPPPPLPSKLLGGAKSVRRVPEVVELYRLLTKKDAHMDNRNNATATPVMAFNKNMIGEIENRSSYLSAVSVTVSYFFIEFFSFVL